MNRAEVLAHDLVRELRKCDCRVETVTGDGELVIGVNVWPPYRHADRYPWTTVWLDEAERNWIWGDSYEYGSEIVSAAIVAHRILATLPPNQ